MGHHDMTSDLLSPRRVLVLYHWGDPSRAMRPAIQQHLHVLDVSPAQHQILYHDVAQGVPGWLTRIGFDAIILHTTLLCLRWSSLYAPAREDLRWLGARDCVKIALPQDEYDHSEVLDEWLDEMGVSVVGTVFDESVRSVLYPKMNGRARFLRCLTGYIDEANAARCKGDLRPIAERPRDIVYRAAHLPYWFGSHGQLKHDIAGVVAERAQAIGLSCDISTRSEDVITGDDWYGFLASGKTIIGCESGSSVLDRRGEVQARIRAWLDAEPGLSFSDVSRRLPSGWDDYRFFALGPRHLEAIVTRTCQVLIEGDYDGVLQANRHYLPIRRDLGNLDEVLHMIKDHALLEATAARAYEEIYESRKYTYGALAGLLDAELAAAPPRASVVPWACVTGLHTGSALLWRVCQPIVSFVKRLHPRRIRDWVRRRLSRGEA